MKMFSPNKTDSERVSGREKMTGNLRLFSCLYGKIFAAISCIGLAGATVIPRNYSILTDVTSTPWNSARSACEGLNMTLATVDGTSSQFLGTQVLTNKFQTNVKDHLWLGLYDSNVSDTGTGGYKWYQTCQLLSSWSQWESGQPYDAKNALCVFARNDTFDWQTDTCDVAHHFLCEKRLSVCTYSAVQLSCAFFSSASSAVLLLSTLSACMEQCENTLNNVGLPCWGVSQALTTCTLYYQQFQPACIVATGSSNYYARTCFQLNYLQGPVAYAQSNSSLPITNCDPLTSQPTASTTRATTTSTSLPANEATMTSILQTELTTVSVASSPTVTTDPPATPTTITQQTTNIPEVSVNNTTEVFSSTAMATSANASAATTTGSLLPLVSLQLSSTASVVPGFTLPDNTTTMSVPGFTLPANTTTVSVPGVTLPANMTALVVPGVTLPDNTTYVAFSEITIPEISSVVSVPGITLNSATSTDSSTKAALCKCKCEYTPHFNMTSALQSAEELKEELTLSSETLSSSRRRKESERDNRSSAQGIGYVGVAFLVISALMIILPDVRHLLLHAKSGVPRVKRVRKSKKKRYAKKDSLSGTAQDNVVGYASEQALNLL